MKLTKQQLKQLIKEELRANLQEELLQEYKATEHNQEEMIAKLNEVNVHLQRIFNAIQGQKVEP